jgi:2-keto-4-pentenoate hydratase/2-oxohepta-3-ene-1,7-dioic acid hydratase in catechol pathway
MKLVTYTEPSTLESRSGLWTTEGVVDIHRALARHFAEEDAAGAEELAQALGPPSVLEILRRGRRSRAAVAALADRLAQDRAFLRRLAEEPPHAVYPIDRVHLEAPIPRPGKIIHTAGNFREHANEGQKAGWEFPMPHWISFLKSPSAVIGPYDPIVKPSFTQKLDHEIEVGIVIGRRAKHLTPAEAVDAIAGYVVFNDVTARDVQREEMKSGLLNFGKNFDTFAVFGPWLVTADSVPDVHDLKMELKVNGDPRQVSSTRNLAVKIPEIVSHYSWVTLEPGDIISTGTVSGVAAFRTPDPTPFFLKPGDLVETEVEGLGQQRNRVVAADR